MRVHDAGAMPFPIKYSASSSASLAIGIPNVRARKPVDTSPAFVQISLCWTGEASSSRAAHSTALTTPHTQYRDGIRDARYLKDSTGPPPRGDCGGNATMMPAVAIYTQLWKYKRRHRNDTRTESLCQHPRMHALAPSQLLVHPLRSGPVADMPHLIKTWLGATNIL